MTASAAHRSIDHTRAMAVLIIGGAAIRLAFASTTGLGIDETYMVALGRHMELGYFDHPPLAFWLSRASAIVFGGESAWIVRAPFIALFAASTWLMYRLGRLLFGPTAGLLAAIALNSAPVLGVTTATWVLPDGPLDVAMLAGTLLLSRVLLVPGSPPWLWLAAGLFGGLAILSKFHGVFFFAGSGLFLLTSADHRRWLATPWPYLGAVVAIASVSPALLWNFEHGWASLAFQGARATARVFRPWMPLVALAGQAAFIGPWIWAPLVYATARHARRYTADPASWLLICLGAGPIVFFTLVSAWSDQKPYFHWAAPGYLLLMPLLGRFAATAFEVKSRFIEKWLAGGLAFNVVAMGVVSALCAFPGIAGVARTFSPTMNDPMAEMVDWSGIRSYLAEQGLDGDNKIFIVSRRWYEAAKIDVGLQGSRDVLCIGDDCRGYDFVHTRDHAGDDGIVMVPENAAASAIERIAPLFNGLEPMPNLSISHGPFTIARLSVFRAKAFRPSAKSP